MKFNSKHEKYTTTNPISRHLVSSFYKEVRRLTAGIEFNDVLDVGCGEGNMLRYLSDHDEENRTYNAMDKDERELESARVNIPFCNLLKGSIYKIPFDDNSMDLVLCTEVLEHLDSPVDGLEELFRVTSKYAIVSVPREPLWRIFNIIRFHYWRDLGNTPGHVNHWSRKSFEKLVSRRFKILNIKNPYPWTIILCEKQLS